MLDKGSPRRPLSHGMRRRRKQKLFFYSFVNLRRFADPVPIRIVFRDTRNVNEFVGNTSLSTVPRQVPQAG
jgi:hypothetical protein